MKRYRSVLGSVLDAVVGVGCALLNDKLIGRTLEESVDVPVGIPLHDAPLKTVGGIVHLVVEIDDVALLHLQDVCCGSIHVVVVLNRNGGVRRVVQVLHTGASGCDLREIARLDGSLVAFGIRIDFADAIFKSFGIDTLWHIRASPHVHPFDGRVSLEVC